MPRQKLQSCGELSKLTTGWESGRGECDWGVTERSRGRSVEPAIGVALQVQSGAAAPATSSPQCSPLRSKATWIIWLLASPSGLPPAPLRCLITMQLAPLSCDEIAEPTAAIYPGVNMSCLVLVGCIASAGRPEKNPPAPDRTNLSPPRRPRSSPATMSPSAIFVFLLVSAVHMLECILDLKRRVGANCQENPALSFLSLVPDNSFGE